MAFLLCGKRKRKVLRILLVGRTGHGKSSTCNNLLGKNASIVSSASTSETKTSHKYKVKNRFGRDLEIVDTPGMFDTVTSNSKIHKELIRALILTAPGFHAIAFVLRRDKFTEEIQKTKDLFFEWFSKDVKRHAFVILTDTDTDDEKEAYLQHKPHQKLTELVKDCYGRVVPFQNKSDDLNLKSKQVILVLEMVEEILYQNKSCNFSNLAFELFVSYRKGEIEFTKKYEELFSESIAKKSLTRIQQETINYIFESDHEAQSGSDEIKNTERGMNKSYEQKQGNLLIIDNRTNKPYEHTPDTTSDEMYSVNGDSDEKHSSEENTDATFETNSDTDKEMQGFLSSLRRHMPCNIL